MRSGRYMVAYGFQLPPGLTRRDSFERLQAGWLIKATAFTLIRNLGSLITTRSNAFSAWGVAQTIKRIPKNLTRAGAKPDEFHAGDQVTGERRFRAVVERYVWRCVDAIVGNAETDSSGAFFQLGANAWLGSPTNTKDGTDSVATSFEQSNNPQVAVMKYRVRSFEFLDE